MDEIEILNENQLKKLGMNLLVGQGSPVSYVTIMSWKGSKKKMINHSFYTKGVCLIQIISLNHKIYGKITLWIWWKH